MKYISGPYTSGQLKQKIDSIETSLTNRFMRLKETGSTGAISDAAERRYWSEKIEDASFGRNTVIFDDLQYPSVMVTIPLVKQIDVLAGSLSYPHPAFIVNDNTKATFNMSKYQNIVAGTGASARALSLKGVDPTVNINYDNSLLYCKQKGSGWHLATNAEWAALALLCKSRGFMPRGNNNYGSDHAVTHEKGIPSYAYSGTTIGRVLTGSGPVTWSSDGSPFGVYDLCGNVLEWTGGLRINAGEIQIITNNNAADNTVDQTAATAAWRAMLQNGTLCHTKWVTGTSYALNAVIAPANGKTYKCTTAGTSGSTEPTWPDADTVTDGTAVWTYQADLTLKYDGTATPVISTAVTTGAAVNTTFDTLAAAAGVTVPNLAKLLALAPIDASHGGDRFYVDSRGEKIPFRGGDWAHTSDAGVFALYLYLVRTHTGDNIGFRSAFVS